MKSGAGEARSLFGLQDLATKGEAASEAVKEVLDKRQRPDYTGKQRRYQACDRSMQKMTDEDWCGNQRQPERYLLLQPVPVVLAMVNRG